MQTNTKAKINALNTAFLTQDADKICNSNNIGLHAFYICGAGYAHDDLPADSNYKYAFALVLCRWNASCNIVLFPEGTTPIAVKTKVGSSWGSWKYLTYSK